MVIQLVLRVKQLSAGQQLHRPSTWATMLTSKKTKSTAAACQNIIEYFKVRCNQLVLDDDDDDDDGMWHIN